VLVDWAICPLVVSSVRNAGSAGARLHVLGALPFWTSVGRNDRPFETVYSRIVRIESPAGAMGVCSILQSGPDPRMRFVLFQTRALLVPEAVTAKVAAAGNAPSISGAPCIWIVQSCVM
jgi:hypothetical protein